MKMNKIALTGLDTFLYHEKLPNGLDVYLVPFENKKNYFVTYSTKFGSNQIEFIPEGKEKMIKVPEGIAHFLEHKMFEQEDGIDPFTFFNKSGTGANASTNFTNTQYICYGTNEFETNLEFLLEYVNKPFFTDENVEKEKGIIKEELQMYDDMPAWVMENELRKCVYKNHPTRIDIGGTVESIYQITKEDLYNCYNTFYKPDNMFIVAAGNFDPEKILELIKKQQKNIKNNTKDIVQKKYEEPLEVNQKEKTLDFGVEIPKVGMCLKIKNDIFKEYSKPEIFYYLNMIGTLNFGLTSDFREEGKKAQLFTGLYYDWNNYDDIYTFDLIAETTKPNDLINKIKEKYEDIKVLEKDMERIKKVWIASEVKLIDNVENTVYNIHDDIVLFGDIVPNKVDIIRNLSYENLNKIIKSIDFTNLATVILMPKSKK